MSHSQQTHACYEDVLPDKADRYQEVMVMMKALRGDGDYDEVMTCNIDSRGRAVRLVMGLLSVLGALVLMVLCLMGMLVSQGWWVLIVFTFFAGLFAIYEARAGWCALRAMGVRTPI